MKVSVVIPCYNQQIVLLDTLATLHHQTEKPDEIIVVDDGSDTPISVPPDVQLVRIDRESRFRGSSEAKNLGAKKANGDWLCFSDADILHMSDAIKSLKEYVTVLKRDDVLINLFSVAVPVKWVRNSLWNRNHPETLESVVAAFPYPTGLVAAMNVGAHSVSSEQHCGFIKREYFERLGGYDEATFKSWGLNNQDLSLRVIDSGGLIFSEVFRPDGKLLYCIHQYDGTARDSETAKAEFKSKYGKTFMEYSNRERRCSGSAS